MKILIIDDDPSLCESMEDMLEMEGYLVESVNTAKDGIEKVEQDYYNIIVLDLKLPDSDGIESLERIRMISPDTEVIIFTAYAETESVIEAMDKGAFSYLPKSSEASNLTVSLKRASERQSLLFENRKLFQKVLQGKNEWEITFDSIKDLISIHDVDSNIIKCNKALAEKMNAAPEDIVGEKCYKIFHGCNDPLPGCAILRCIETLKPTEEEVEFMGGFYLMSCYPRFDESGKFNGIVHIAREISEKKQFETKLLQRESLFRSTFDMAGVGIAHVSLDGHFLRLNKLCCEIIGHSEEKIIGLLTSKDILRSHVLEDDNNFEKRLIAGEIEVHSVEKRLMKKDGSISWVNITVSLVRGTDGEPEYFIFILKDVTKRKQMEILLIESEAKFKSISNSANDAVIMLGNNDSVSFWNNAAENLFGFSREEIIGKKIYEMIIPADMQADHIKEFKAFSKSGQGKFVGKRVELTAINKEGKEFPVELSLSAVKINGKWNAIGIVRDIAEQRKIKEIQDKQIRISLLGAEVGAALINVDTLQKMLNKCADSFVKNYNAALVRIWTLNEGENILKLQASAGMYTHIDGTHSRIPVGSLEIGKIAEQRKPYLTNNMINDPWVSDKDWVRKENLTAFVGFPLIVDNQLLGVLAMFSRKPLTKDTIDLLLYTADEIALGIKRKVAEKIIEHSVEKLKTTLSGTITALSVTVEQKDPYTAGHQRRVTQLASVIAEKMGLSNDKIEGLKTAGIVHDIGKMRIPTEILGRPGKLTKDEFNIVKSHAQVGYEILKGIEFPWPVAEIVHQHHEHMDGSGYPQGLSNGDILMEARILCVADVVEAMSSHRPYRPSLGMDFALEQISKNKGVQYDERVVSACLQVIHENGFVFK